MESKFKTRRYIIDDLIKQYALQLIEKNYTDKTKFLKHIFKCDCTDCGGNISVGECNLEIKYYKQF